MKIEDKTNELPWHKTKKWNTRSLSKIKIIIIHQELGESNIEAVNQYHIGKNHISSTGCPHFCYHFGIERDGSIIQANEYKHVTWHTKGKNTVALGIMLVGNFKGTGYNLGTRGPNKKQLESLEWIVNYLKKKFSLSNIDVYGHYHFGKPACPGFETSKWIEELRGEIPINQKEVKRTVKNLQLFLNKLGFKCGKEDGIFGVKTYSAVMAFQKKYKLKPDGVAGFATWNKLIETYQKK